MSRNGNNVAKHEGESSTVQRQSMILGPESGTDLVRSGARGTSASTGQSTPRRSPLTTRNNPAKCRCLFVQSMETTIFRRGFGGCGHRNWKSVVYESFATAVIWPPFFCTLRKRNITAQKCSSNSTCTFSILFRSKCNGRVKHPKKVSKCALPEAWGLGFYFKCFFEQLFFLKSSGSTGTWHRSADASANATCRVLANCSQGWMRFCAFFAHFCHVQR